MNTTDTGNEVNPSTSNLLTDSDTEDHLQVRPMLYNRYIDLI